MKNKILGALVIMILLSVSPAHAAINNLNGLTGNTQTFTNDTNIRINSSGTAHAIQWLNGLSVDRGGTGRKILSTGQLLFGDTAASISQSANLFWDKNNNRLGIGNSSPDSVIDVTGSILASGSGNVDFTLRSGSDLSKFTIRTNSSFGGRLDIINQSNILLSIASTGFVGIGTTIPTYKLDVNGDLHATQIITNTISATGTNQSIALNPTGTGKVVIGGESLVVAKLASQPASASTGQVYFDTVLKKFRGYNGTSWVSFSTSPTTAKILVVAGGGQGGGNDNNYGGGGGAGGVVYATDHVIIGTSYSITIGPGGSSAGANVHGANGSDSVFSDGANTVTAIGGGGGGVGAGGSGGANGSDGGSGGGPVSGNTAGVSTQGDSGGGIGYGNDGGTSGNGNGHGGGGSGGDGGVGVNDGAGGNGGNGIADATIGGLLTMTSSGVNGFIAGGGGGGGSTDQGGNSGSGGGGHGGLYPSNTGISPGTENTGGGGGGSAKNSSVAGDAGGSGLVIIVYKNLEFDHTYSGTSTTGTNGSETWVKMTTSGTLTLTAL